MGVGAGMRRAPAVKLRNAPGMHTSPHLFQFAILAVRLLQRASLSTSLPAPPLPLPLRSAFPPHNNYLLIIVASARGGGREKGAGRLSRRIVSGRREGGDFWRVNSFTASGIPRADNTLFSDRETEAASALIIRKGEWVFLMLICFSFDRQNGISRMKWE